MIKTTTVTLNPGEAKTVAFTFTPSAAGVHSVNVDGLGGSFTVLEPAAAEYPWDLDDLINVTLTMWLPIPLWSGSYCYTVKVVAHGYRGREGVEWYTFENPDGSRTDLEALILLQKVNEALEHGCPIG